MRVEECFAVAFAYTLKDKFAALTGWPGIKRVCGRKGQGIWMEQQRNGACTLKQISSYLVFLFFLVTVDVQLSTLLFQQGVAWQLSGVHAEEDDFRRLSLSEQQLASLVTICRDSGMRPGELLAILRSDIAKSARVPGKAVSNSGSQIRAETLSNSVDFLLKWKLRMLRYNSQGFERVSGYYSAILDDVVCFPVDSDGIVYENSWMFERNYGGRRGHEGTDLMPPENLRGQYRIVSMTEGIVEKIGWLPLGGYRIGIRSPSGGYFYYAHLDSYSRSFRVGEHVSAGTVLGWMGDTGYGPEGTRGKFDVHLHLGIYIRTENAQELSVNPYWVLRFAQAIRA